MDDFKRTNMKLATALDYNAPRMVKRHKGDGKRLRRYARRKLKQNIWKLEFYSTQDMASLIV